MNLKRIVSIFLGATLLFGTCAHGLENSSKKAVKRSSVNKTLKIAGTATAAVAIAALTMRYAANSFIFWGSKAECGDSKDNDGYKSDFIRVGCLSGRTFELKNPESRELEGKCVLVFSPNAGSAAGMVRDAYFVPECGCALYQLMKRGAKLVGIDYRGYGNSDSISRLRISESTVYADGENMYNYVTKELGYSSENVILFAHSIGGAVASHVAAYASGKGQSLGGIIFASPINNLYSAAQAFTKSRVWAAVARVASMSELNTVSNLSKVGNKNTPVFICSGDDQDVLSINKTNLASDIEKIGFNDVTKYVAPECNHNDLTRMFGLEKRDDIEHSKYIEFINKKLANKSVD